MMKLTVVFSQILRARLTLSEMQETLNESQNLKL